MDLRFSISDRYWVVKLAEICPAGLLDGSWPRGTTLIWESSLVFSFLQFTSHQNWTTKAGCGDFRRALHYFRIPLEAVCLEPFMRLQLLPACLMQSRLDKHCLSSNC